MADQTPMKAAALTMDGCALCEDGSIAFVFRLADPRHMSSSDPLWPKPFVVRVKTEDMQAETAKGLIAQFEAADASPEAEGMRKANAFLGKLMGL